MQSVFFITGTDTAVGKTVLTGLLAGFLRDRGVSVAAFKPLCSGGREDAVALRAALGGALALDEINPWHFRAPLAPALAAKREGRIVTLPQVRAYILSRKNRFAITLVEGAGGLLSPLGEHFDSRDLIAALRATPVIVAPNRLGVVNHVLLTFAALPKNARSKARVVLMSPPKPDASTTSNASLLAQILPPERLLTLPWLGANYSAAKALNRLAVKRVLQQLVG